MASIREIISSIGEWKEDRRTEVELTEALERLSFELFASQKGQQWLELWRRHIHYDADPYIYHRENDGLARNMQGLHDSYPKITALMKRGAKRKEK